MTERVRKKGYQRVTRASVAACMATLALTTACRPASNQSAQMEAANGAEVPYFGVQVDQVGYVPEESKMAFVSEAAEKFTVKNGAGETVLEGCVGTPIYWAEAGDSIRLIDFSSLKAEGEYSIEVDGRLKSAPFCIKSAPYRETLRKVCRAFYYNRASMAIDEEHGGRWARASGHPDTKVKVHATAASASRPEGTELSMSGGWYDAGDYNKYIVNSSITVYTMLLASQMYGPMDLDLNIPDHREGVADLTTETLYNLRWMLTMQDPEDGGVYHKLTTLNFEGFIMPADCKGERYVIQKSTGATLDFAATMAAASRMLPNLMVDEGLKSLADSCKEAAIKAYAWAVANPDKAFDHNPEGVTTGAYEDVDLDGEWFWASTEMALSVDYERYRAEAAKYAGDYGVPEWGNTGTLAYMSMVEADMSVTMSNPADVLWRITDELMAMEAANPAAVSLKKYDWGSNSFVANGAMVKLMAIASERAMTERAEKAMQSVRNDVHYLLGRNATGYCFVTGVGSKSPMHIHHRPSAADGIEEPVPGFLVGGPNLVQPTDCGGDGSERGIYPAKGYEDVECSYSTNEIAINWNAPMVFTLLGVK